MKPLYILLVSVHGLIRSRDLELGRDADTGGQTLYVVELEKKSQQIDELKKENAAIKKQLAVIIEALKK